MPEEEPAVPIEPAVAAARTRYVKAKIEIVKALKGDGMTRRGEGFC